MAICSPGWRTQHFDHSHSAHDVSASWPNNVAGSSFIGAPAGKSTTPLDPTCRQITVSVSAHAVRIGSHQSEKIGSIPIRCGCSGNVTARNPRAALRRISSAATSASARNVMPIGTIRSGWRECHSSKNQSFHARVTARPSSGSEQRENTEPQNPVIWLGKFTDAQIPLMSMSRTRASTS